MTKSSQTSKGCMEGRMQEKSESVNNKCLSDLFIPLPRSGILKGRSSEEFKKEKEKRASLIFSDSTFSNK